MLSRSDLSRLATALNGLPVMGCLAGSPAAEAGMRYGDVLLAIDGIPTPGWDEFIEARRHSRGGFTARIFRDGVELDLRIDFADAPARSGAELLAELAAMH